MGASLVHWGKKKIHIGTPTLVRSSSGPADIHDSNSSQARVFLRSLLSPLLLDLLNKPPNRIREVPESPTESSSYGSCSGEAKLPESGIGGQC